MYIFNKILTHRAYFHSFLLHKQYKDYPVSRRLYLPALYKAQLSQETLASLWYMLELINPRSYFKKLREPNSKYIMCLAEPPSQELLL